MTYRPFHLYEPLPTEVCPPQDIAPQTAEWPPLHPIIGRSVHSTSTLISATDSNPADIAHLPPPEDVASNSAAPRALLALAFATILAAVAFVAFTWRHERQLEIDHRQEIDQIRMSAAASQLSRLRAAKSELQWWLDQDDAWRRGRGPLPAPPPRFIDAPCCIPRAQLLSRADVTEQLTDINIVIHRLEREVRPSR